MKFMWIKNPETNLLQHMRNVWDTITTRRIRDSQSSGPIGRPYWSEDDLVSHFMHDLEMTLPNTGDPTAAELDWHVNFTLRPNLFLNGLSANIQSFKKTIEKKYDSIPDLIVNYHRNESDSFLLHGEAKVWFGGRPQSVRSLDNDLVKLESSRRSGVCVFPLMIVVYDPAEDAEAVVGGITAICSVLAQHSSVNVLTYPLDMCAQSN